MALWIGLLLAWFVLALVGALALGRVLRGLNRPLRTAPHRAVDASKVTGPAGLAITESSGPTDPSARRSRHGLRRRPTPAA